MSEKADSSLGIASGTFSEGEDLFSASLNMSDADRRRYESEAYRAIVKIKLF